MTVKPRPLPRLLEGRAISAFAFDLDGTVYLGGELLPGSLELGAFLEQQGFPFVFATNNSSVSAERYLEKLRGFGLRVGREHVITSNDVTTEYLRRAGFKAPFLLATPEVEAEYEQQDFLLDAKSPDCVVLTFDTTLTYDKLRRAARLILAGTPYLATHPDLVCPTPEGPIPDTGAFIALLEAATGVRPTVLGKPESVMAAAIAKRCGAPEGATAFVGDRLYTDIRMANENGFFAVLTLTGEASLEDAAKSPYRPDLIVASLADLLSRLQDAQA